MTKVLQGVRVVEHGTFITGPAASMLLADLGAEVIKVELPVTGDPFRASMRTCTASKSDESNPNWPGAMRRPQASWQHPRR